MLFDGQIVAGGVSLHRHKRENSSPRVRAERWCCFFFNFEKIFFVGKGAFLLPHPWVKGWEEDAALLLFALAVGLARAQGVML